MTALTTACNIAPRQSVSFFGYSFKIMFPYAVGVLFTDAVAFRPVMQCRNHLSVSIPVCSKRLAVWSDLRDDVIYLRLVVRHRRKLTGLEWAFWRRDQIGPEQRILW